jgi:uncharacterized protein YdaU (DUF1376 family)
MAAKRPAFQFYPREYLTDEHVVLMNLEEQGAYVRLLCHQWLEGSVPAEIPALARLCGVAPAKMKRLWVCIAPKFQATPDGRLVNERLERARKDTEEWKATQAEAGRRGAEKRWAAHAEQDRQPMPTPMAKNSTASVTASEKKKASLSKKSLPEDWTPNEKHRKLAAELRVDVELEAVKFRDWAVANAKVMADWNAAFRNWLRNSKPGSAPAAKANGAVPPSPFHTTPKALRGF